MIIIAHGFDFILGSNSPDIKIFNSKMLLQAIPANDTIAPDLPSKPKFKIIKD